VGAEGHGTSLNAKLDTLRTALFLGSDRPEALRQAMFVCRKGGTVSVPGVYLGFLNRMPFGAAMNKGLTFKMGQTHVQKYLKLLLKKIEDGKIDPSFIITHRFKLDDAPRAYDIFKNKEDNCIKVVLTP
jgi:threonine dehydrogenase-like Zn-dependent dehydrogenase